MVVLIVSSKTDPASINIKNSLLKQSSWNEINTFDGNPVYRHSEMKDVLIATINDSKIRHENLDKEIEDKLGFKLKQIIFASRHRSKMGKPTLTVHPIGNYGKADFGGKPKTLVTSSPKLMTHLLRLIKKNLQLTDLNYQVCYEVTHHGPYLEVPTFFAEVGSTELEWNKKEPAEIIARSISSLIKKYHYEEDLPDDIPVLIGIGGGHYAPRFTDVIFEKKVAFGHMIPKYQIDNGNINPAMLQETVQKTPNVEGVYFDKKSLRKSLMKEYKKWFENNNIPVLSSKNLVDL